MAVTALAEPGVAPLPLALRMRGRLAVVVGGGAIAEDAVGRLLMAGARVLVVAPAPGPRLADLAARDVISVRAREYRAADLDGAWLLLTCGPGDVNASAAADAAERRIWSAHGAAGQPSSDEPSSGEPIVSEPEPGQPNASDHGSVTAALLPDPWWSARQAPGERARRVLVLGGARSGKSAAAESMLSGAAAVDYVATGPRSGRGDAEWDQRIREHQARRPAGWRTLETIAVADVLTSAGSAGPVLVDCLATWLAQVMDDCGLWSESQSPGARDADAGLGEQTGRLIAAWQRTSRHAVAVSNEVGCGVVPGTASGRRFRDELGWLNSRIAAASDEVWLCTAGIPSRLR